MRRLLPRLAPHGADRSSSDAQLRADGRAPKIAVPTRTWVAPSWIAELEIGAHAHGQLGQPVARAICARSAKCGRPPARRPAECTSGPSIASPKSAAAGRHEGVGVLRQHARLLRLAAGVDLRRAGAVLPAGCSAISARRAPRRCCGRSTVSITSNSSTASLALLDLQRPDQVQLDVGKALAASAGHWPSPPARGSRRRRAAPAASTGAMASAGNVFDTATSASTLVRIARRVPRPARTVRRCVARRRRPRRPSASRDMRRGIAMTRLRIRLRRRS